MITERTLKKWRKEALKLKSESISTSLQYQLSDRILRMTQELLDLHLIKE